MSATGVPRVILASWLVVAACRLGGPSGWSPPDARTPDAPAVDARGEVVPLDDARTPDTPAEDARGEVVPLDVGAPDASGDATTAAGAGCVPPFVAEVCDPVCNSGCPPLSRCDVSSLPRRGACVGIFVVGEGGLCFRGITTDSCAVQLTCLDGRCRRLCYRDADCTAGSCCSHPVEATGGPSGFAVCAPCDPPPQQRAVARGEQARGGTP
jgi:hypothetical protein